MVEYQHLGDEKLRELHAIHRRNLELLETQRAKSGSIHERLDLQHQIRDEQNELNAIAAEVARRGVPTQTTVQVSTPAPQPAASANPFEQPSQQPTGRDDELQRILGKLRNGHCSLIGPLGSGKTLLLRAITTQFQAQYGCSHPEVLDLPLRMLRSLPQLQSHIAQQLGTQSNRLTNALSRKPLRLVWIDDMGAMETGKAGYQIRDWLRGLADHYGTKLLFSSNVRVNLLFDDDPNRSSPFATLDSRPTELLPLAPSVCHQIVTARLAGTPFAPEQFAAILATPHQPRALLDLCYTRFDELSQGQQ